MPGWADFAVIVGGAAAALTGLLFVAVTLRIDTIGPSVALRSRAAQTLVLLTVVVLLAAALVAPQPPAAFAVESLLLGLVQSGALAGLAWRARRTGGTPRALDRLLAATSPSALGSVLLVAGAVLLLTGVAFQAVAAALGLVGGVFGAWAFLVRGGPEQAADPAAAPGPRR